MIKIISMRKIMYQKYSAKADGYSPGEYNKEFTELGYFHEWVFVVREGLFAVTETQEGEVKMIPSYAMKFVEEFPQEKTDKPKF